MKTPALAAVLNFVFPGAGLWYLREWSYGFINMAAFFGVEILIQAMSRQFYVEYRGAITLMLAAASAAVGYQTAKALSSRSGGHAG
jgi:hypothetical protein